MSRSGFGVKLYCSTWSSLFFSAYDQLYDGALIRIAAAIIRCREEGHNLWKVGVLPDIGLEALELRLVGANETEQSVLFQKGVDGVVADDNTRSSMSIRETDSASTCLAEDRCRCRQGPTKARRKGFQVEAALGTDPLYSNQGHSQAQARFLRGERETVHL